MEDFAKRLAWVFALGLALVGRAAFSAPASASRCKVDFRDLSFSAEFSWELWAGKGQLPLRVQFGKTRTARGAIQPMARMLTRAGRCEAVCEIASWTKLEDGKPASAELLCRSPSFSVLTSTVTVYWVHPKQGKAYIRFGRWLDSYEEYPLQVKLDRISAPGAEPTFLTGLAKPRATALAPQAN